MKLLLAHVTGWLVLHISAHAFAPAKDLLATIVNMAQGKTMSQIVMCCHDYLCSLSDVNNTTLEEIPADT